MNGKDSNFLKGLIDSGDSIEEDPKLGVFLEPKDWCSQITSSLVDSPELKLLLSFTNSKINPMYEPYGNDK